MNPMNNMNMHNMGPMGPGMQMPGGMMQQQSPQMGQGMPPGMAQGMVQGMGQSMPTQMGQGMPQQMGQGMPQQMAQGMPQQMGQGMPQQMGQGMPQQMGQGIPQQMGQGMPQQMGQGMPQNMPPQMQQPMTQPLPQQPQPHEKIDNISKIKSLMGPLRESLTATLKSAAQLLKQNFNLDSGTQKGIETPAPRFDKHLEEFYSLCDQMEIHLTTALLCIQQAQSAGHYLPLTVMPSRMEPPSAPQDGNSLSYPQYLSTVRAQVAYAKEIHDTLVAAAQNITPTE